MLFRIGKREIGNLTYHLLPYEFGDHKVILGLFVGKRGKVLCCCKTIIKNPDLDEQNETIQIPKSIAQVKLSGCYSPFLIRNITIGNTVEIVIGIHKGTIGEVVSIEKKRYGQIYYVQFPSKCVCPFTEMEIEKIEVRGQMKFFS